MEKYFEILDKINEENIDMTKLYLLSCLYVPNKSNKYLVLGQMEFCYDVWLEADVDMNLARLADIVQEHWEEIQNDEFPYEDIIEVCLDI